MIYIAAGNYGQAEQHARANQLPKEGWCYVGGIRDIRDAKGLLHTVGTFWNRKDSCSIYAYARARGMC